jgi:hypothetical protein
MAKSKVIELTVQRKEGFSQVVLWPGVTGAKDNPAEFEQWILDEFGTRAQFLEEITTLPGDGGPGGRNDVLFAVHHEDIAKFAVPRLAYGMRWIEDVLKNEADRTTHSIYPSHVSSYATW